MLMATYEASDSDGRYFIDSDANFIEMKTRSMK